MKINKLETDEQKVTRTVMDTMLVRPMDVKKWKIPPLQRPLRENEKVRKVAEEMKINGGVWPGVITLGRLNGQDTYVIDGQHRMHAFLISGIEEGYVDVRIHHVKSMSEIGDEFVKLNSQLVTMSPDDILRALEPILPTLQTIRKRCPFVGYDSIRRNETSPVVGMSVVVRCWNGSASPCPAYRGTARASAEGIDDVDDLCDLLNIFIKAWGHTPEVYRLWGSLNMILCMWLYRHMVIPGKDSLSRSERFSKELFQKCLMSLSADAVYLSWLLGRILRELDRPQAYSRLKAIISSRAAVELGRKVKLPQPPWAT